MPYLQIRLTEHQNSANDRVDYNRVHAAMSAIHCVQEILGFRTLPGMYRRYINYASLTAVRDEIRLVLEPLGYRFQIQIIEVANELDFKLEPTPSFYEALFGLSSAVERPNYGLLGLGFRRSNETANEAYGSFSNAFWEGLLTKE